MHDTALDTFIVPLTKSAIASPVETLAIDLLPAAGGGTLAIRWGKAGLAASFQFAK
jgi:hypothetical protein